MISDDSPPLDESFLAALLAADGDVAAGRDQAGSDIAETRDTMEMEGLSGYIHLLRRLGHRSGPMDLTSPGSDQSPLQLERFEIISLLGQGGFGIVYLARDPKLGRQVAVKIPRPEVLNRSDVRIRFLREARAAAGLDHPNLVPVYDAGEAGPLCFIASAYCPGPTLAAWLKGRAEPVRPDIAARLVADLADAVQHAHERGILHRDIKPSNVILTSPHGQRAAGADPPAQSWRPAAGEERLSPRLTDFGLAKVADEPGEETRTGLMLGSPPYMAPEQAAGRNRDVGPATDVYALGGTLYEILTGRPPFRGETSTETLRLVLEGDCVAPRALRPGLPRDLETICLKCLEKDPGRRYATAAELAADLQRYLAHEPIRARPASLRVRAAKWIRRRPLQAAAITLASLVAGTLTGGIAYRHVLLQGHARELEREIVRADHNALLSRRHLLAFQLRQAGDALSHHRVERAQDILSAIRAEGARVDIRQPPGDLGFAWNYLMTAAQRQLVVLSDRQSERVSEISLSPDGRTLATGDVDGTIRLRDPETGKVASSLEGHQYPISCLAFSADGSRLASVATLATQPHPGCEVFLWDLDSKRLLARLEGFSDRNAGQLAFDARGERLWEVSDRWDGRSRLAAWDVVTDPTRPRLAWSVSVDAATQSGTGGGPIAVLEQPGERFHLEDLKSAMSLGWRGSINRHQFAASSPDGRLLAVVASPRVVVWDVLEGRERTHFESPRVPSLTSFCFSPDGRYLAMDSVTGHFELRDLRTGTTRRIPSDSGAVGSSSSFAFSPDGRFLARNVWRLGRAQPIEIWQLELWQRVATYPGELGGVSPITWQGATPIVQVNQACVRWNPWTPTDSRQPAGHTDEAWSVAFSPDGSILATGSDDTTDLRTIKLWDVATGKLLRGWNAGGGTVAALALDPRGKVLASAHLDKPGEVRVWDASNGERLATLEGHTDFVRTIAFSPDGKYLASAGTDRVIRLWDVASRGCIRILEGHADTVRQVAFSPDGTRLASASNDFTVRLWDVARAALVHTLRTTGKVAAVAFAPGGKSLAAADEKGIVFLLDTDSGRRARSMPVENDYLFSLAFSPDGRTLAVAGKSRTIRLLDPLTAQEQLTLDGHQDQVNALAFSPDGTVLASCSHDGAVHLWRAPRADLARFRGSAP